MLIDLLNLPEISQLSSIGTHVKCSDGAETDTFTMSDECETQAINYCLYCHISFLPD